MIQRGLAWLDSQLTEHVSQLVTYRRGEESVDVYATFGPKLLKLTDEFGGIRMEWTDMDFTFAWAGVAFATGPAYPVRGDEIDLTVGDDTHTFQVFPFGTEPPYRWCDPNQVRVRVHTKRIGAIG